MVRRRIDEAVDAMNGTLESLSGAAPAAAMWTGAEIDSRRVEGGELFFALLGEHTDGHRFVGAALEAGAAAAVISDRSRVDECSTGLLISVADVTAGLHDLTRAVRQSAPERLVAITGSAGKTTTKEYLAKILAQGFRTASSPGNFNNLLGFPLSLLRIADDTQWMVAEMGMSEPGELGEVSRLGRPDVAVFTNVRPAHLAGFEASEHQGEDPLRAIAEAKSELLSGLAPGGLIVANAADPWVTWLVARHRASVDPQVRVAWYRLATDARAAPALPDIPSPGEDGDLELVASDVRERAPIGTRFRLEASNLTDGADDPAGADLELPVHGVINVRNLLAAATVAHALGIELETIASIARSFEAPAGRGRVQTAHGVTVIDDTYNANPEAMTAALQAAHQLFSRAAEPGRLACVLGDMRELGAESAAYHRATGEQAARLGFEPIFTVGLEAGAIAEAARAAGAAAVTACDDAQEAAAALHGLARPGDLWLVKGSRGVALEAIVPILLSRANDGADDQNARDGKGQD